MRCFCGGRIGDGRCLYCFSPYSGEETFDEVWENGGFPLDLEEDELEEDMIEEIESDDVTVPIEDIIEDVDFDDIGFPAEDE